MNPNDSTPAAPMGDQNPVVTPGTDTPPAPTDDAGTGMGTPAPMPGSEPVVTPPTGMGDTPAPAPESEPVTTPAEQPQTGEVTGPAVETPAEGAPPAGDNNGQA